MPKAHRKSSSEPVSSADRGGRFGGLTLCNLLHELLGHGGATLLPLGVDALSVSTVGLTTTASNPVVAAAGPVVNLALSLGLLLSLSHRVAPTWRYFAWLFGTVNAFNATAYLSYSAILGTGDWAVAIASLDPPHHWRLVLGLCGLLAYAASIHVSVVLMRRLVAVGVVASSQVDRYCTSSYWVGGILLTTGAVPNPVSPWLILTSGAATGFGAMLGLLVVPPLVRRGGSSPLAERESLRVTRSWVVAGALAAAVFVGVFGPGVSPR